MGRRWLTLGNVWRTSGVGVDWIAMDVSDPALSLAKRRSRCGVQVFR